MHIISQRKISLGKSVLAPLLEEKATTRGHALQQFQIQPTFKDKRPDTVVEPKDGRYMVVDNNKAPKPQTRLRDRTPGYKEIQRIKAWALRDKTIWNLPRASKQS
jgi:competence CoiA-like predicted nuclease